MKDDDPAILLARFALVLVASWAAGSLVQQPRKATDGLTHDGVGAGLANLGNMCFMNSVLQVHTT